MAKEKLLMVINGNMQMSKVNNAILMCNFKVFKFNTK